MTTGLRAAGSALFIYMSTTALFGFHALPAAGQVEEPSGQVEESSASQETAAAAPSTFLGRLIGSFAVEGTGEGVDSSVDSSDLQLRHQGDVQNALSTIPNVLTRQSPSQPGIEVNIRGMSGYGRVNSMIDGVPQNFRNVAGHEASGGNLLYVHPELLAGVDITRGAVSGAKGSGTLSGAANFRTLSIEDVLRDGALQGAWTRLKSGTNGQKLSGMMALGRRFDELWGGEGRVDVLLAYAYANEGNYKTGDGVTLPDGPSGYASANKPRGALAKIDIAPNSRHELKFGLRTYDNTFQNSSYTWDVSNRTWTGDYHYTPQSPLIDLTVSTYYNDTNLNYPGTGGSYAGRRTQEESYGVALTNRAQALLGSGSALQLEYGVSWDRDNFQTHAMRGGNHPGKLDKASIFGEAAIDLDRLSLRGGLRYDYWHINGYRPPYAAGVADCPPDGPACGDEWAKTDGGRLLPKIAASYQVTPELSLRGSYSHTLRPPTTHEAFFSLVPFGDGVGTGMTNNLDLKPEFSRNLEFGVNYHGRSLWVPGDEATLRVTVFRNRIKDFIVNDFVDIPGDSFARAMWVNRDGTTVMRGLEIEGGYDSGFFFANLGIALSKTDNQPLGDGAGAGNGEGSALPKRTATLDIGVRPMDERLTLGAQVKYVGSTAQAAYDWSQYPAGSYWSRTDAYSLVGLYGSYEINDRAQAFFTVENLFDKAYGYPGGSSAGYQAMTGRGRTLTAGLSMRF